MKQKKKVLTILSPTPDKEVQITAPQPLPVSENEATRESEQVTGISIPGAIASPFTSFKPEGDVFFRDQHAQQNAMHAYQEHIRAAQNKQRSEQQAQRLMQQLQQLLSTLLDKQTAVSGKCVLVESTDAQKNILQCDPTALHEVLRKDQQNIAWLLIALRGLGKNFNGFAIERRLNTAEIAFIHQESGGNGSKSP